jgi:four helix bundle protein
MAIIRGFRDLDVYVLAREQARKIFVVSKSFPKEERFSLTDQIRRSSRAVNAMIAEAWARRRYPAAFINKIDEAMGESDGNPSLARPRVRL